MNEELPRVEDKVRILPSVTVRMRPYFSVAFLRALRENGIGGSQMNSKDTVGLFSSERKSYDIVFIGHMAAGRIEPFRGEPLVGHGGGSFFGAMAASCLGKKLAVVTRMAQGDVQHLEPLRAQGIDVYVQQSAETTRLRVVYPSANVDERRVFLAASAGFFRTDELPPLQPCLVHLGGLTDQEFTLEFLRTLRERGFRLSVDMQSFVLQVDIETGVMQLRDVPDKREIIRMADFVKLDAKEAQVLTGTDHLESAASILDDWGSRETVITRADGALVRTEGKNYFQKFSNRSVQGRTGRGDTLMGSYLARRLDHPVEDSLRFAAALTSIKVENDGPFRGTVEDVLKRQQML
ncbi:MAG: PfkB family carbohydrate kinase [candidate division WOR-3 bacterium]